MDISSDRWFSDLGMDDYNFIDPCHVNSLDEFTTQHITTALREDLRAPSLSSDHESYSSYPTLNPETTSTTFSASSIETHYASFGRPAKQLKTNSWSSDTKQHVIPKPPPSSSSSLLSFMNNGSPPAVNTHQYYGDCTMKPKDEVVSHGNVNFPSQISKGSYENQNYVPKANQGTKRVTPMRRTSSHAQDHIMAERKRREKLSQRFIALSALVPGLKKMDKASVLGDAIKYLKQLQERVKSLEEQMKETTVESVVFIKKSQLSADDETSSCDENFDGCREDAVRDIEARVSDKNVLIRIHCKKQKGFVAKVLGEIEEHHLSVVNSSVLPFGKHAMDITVVAQMGDEFQVTVKDLVNNLRLAFLKFM
ncbi:hypothetical protein VitviT2T_010818 [Vitis vinifera]|uniref:Transcription factor bHLH25 n=2 Tax=Vitis vinifera TaxID=29760 RepID=A0A438KPR7_VITVI|nr:transcription factor bHLH18 [Vitis vinifera]RVW17905.1 Transcription factor bHLH25 [Vitis vinifera]RVX23189.1 Transcription factor bHLH25 [Vitis vinifera]WJZ91773.1 hypothetical protein VitviT2T_010818 [Vitis vinifera]